MTVYIFYFLDKNIHNVLITIAKKCIFANDFSYPCCDVPKVKFHFQQVTKLQDQKQETGNNYDVISGLKAFWKTDFSVIVLLWAIKFAKKCTKVCCLLENKKMSLKSVVEYWWYYGAQS